MTSPDIKYGRKFGGGTFLGDQGGGFFEKPIEEQVEELGWSHACPTVSKVINDYGIRWVEGHVGDTPEDIRRGGAELARARYAECNFVYGLIIDTARRLNEPLYEELIKPVLRLKSEPDGNHGSEFVPDSHLKQMSPMSTPIGYALPRVVIEQMGRGGENKKRTSERMIKALEAVEETIIISRTPVELVVRLSERVSNINAHPKDVLYHLLSAGILHEENCVTLFKDIITEMRTSAPTLIKAYDSMSSTEKQELGVVDLLS